jgi:hypothetical protein
MWPAVAVFFSHIQADGFEYPFHDSRASVQTKGDVLASEPLAVRVTMAPLSRNLRSWRSPSLTGMS